MDTAYTPDGELVEICEITYNIHKLINVHSRLYVKMLADTGEDVMSELNSIDEQIKDKILECKKFKQRLQRKLNYSDEEIRNVFITIMEKYE